MSGLGGAEKFAAEQGQPGRERALVGAGGSDKLGRRGKFLHVITVAQEQGETVYQVVWTFTDRGAMEAFVERAGRPVWLVESEARSLVERVWGHYGAEGAKRWNSGAGWVVDDMPPLRLIGRDE